MQTGERGLSQDTHLPEVMPVILLLSGVVFPLGMETVQIRIERNRRLIQEVPPDEPILLTYLKDSDGDVSPDNMLGIGVVGRLVSKLNLPGDVLQVVFQGIRRVRYVHMVEVDPFYRAEVSGINENPGNIGAVSRLLVDALNAFSKLMEINRYYPGRRTQCPQDEYGRSRYLLRFNLSVSQFVVR